MDAVRSYAKSKGVSETEAYNTLEKMGHEGFADASVSAKILGNGVSTGGRIYSGEDDTVSKGEIVIVVVGKTAMLVWLVLSTKDSIWFEARPLTLLQEV
ncbi:IncF plasmid conjugative transfer protein TraG (plasmid) [Klebsiella sp. PL-2018]|nr:IncF plasmid conjugative transfer protein TraG [Klebsiella sp. PL-2018]